MGKDDKYYKSAGKTVKIKCRVEHCQKVMLRQRYRNHLVECQMYLFISKNVISCWAW